MVALQAPSPSVSDGGDSGNDRRIEPFNELGELLDHAGVVAVGTLANEVDHLAIAVGRVAAVAARLVHHAEPVPAIVHIGEAQEQVVCGRLGFIELARGKELHHGIGSGIERIVVSIFLLGPRQKCGGNLCQARGSGGFIASRRGLSRCIWALTSLSRSAVASLVRQHFLYLLPLPQWQRSLRPGFGAGLTMRVGAIERGTHPLYRDLLADATFHQLLLACDGDLADAARAGRCVLCGGALHSACYPRKPRGRPCRLGPEHDRRFSFCCAVDGCRSRATPPSLRFLGRKVYVAAIVVLVAILHHGVTTSRIDRLSQAVSVDRRTVERWRRWWRERFPATPFWQVARAAFMPPIDHQHLPASLLERFAGDGVGCLIALLRFIGPITGGCVHAR
jgi:hypothetical protein